MRVHYVQHVPFEGPANVDEWARGKGFATGMTRLFAAEPLPALDAFDWLVILGGPMNVYEEVLYPWLEPEKRFIAAAIEAGKRVFGICLGAQLIATAIGGRVYRNPHKEIGWYPVVLSPAGKRSVPFDTLPDRLVAFHWHGDAIELPPGVAAAAGSEACSVQAFAHGDGRVVGLQFHIESTEQSVRLLTEHCADELVAGPFIQSADDILSGCVQVPIIRSYLELLLDNMLRLFPLE